MRRNAAITVVLTGVALTLLLGLTPASAAGPPAPAEPATVPGTTTVITLITGDTVRVDGDDHPSVTPAAGREGAKFITQRIDGHLHVVPADALGLLTRGLLDGRLFDVTALREAGYGDGRADLPLILRRASTSGAARTSDPIAGTSAETVAELPALHARAIRQPKSHLPALWRALTGGETDPHGLRAGVTKVWLDGMRTPSLDHSAPQIGADQAWAAGADGTGAVVAVLDTGIDAGHPDLAEKVVAEKNFTTDPDGDQVGHGTHVASTIAGSGAASGGRYRGIAPGARLLDGKVCLKAINLCPDSAIIEAMQWAVDQRADVVNMSLGGPDGWETDPLEEAVNSLTASSGTLFVIAAGNEGSRGTIGSPASAEAALAVGAVNRDDQIAGFSNQGPRTHDIGLKPEITAPGVDITAARARDGVFGAPGDLYTVLSGTSMATPHVAGSAAILAGEHPDWKATRLKATLIGSAHPVPGTPTIAQGAGRVDVARAIGQQVTASPSTLTFGLAVWPHADDPIAERTLTYRNDGDQPLTLHLALSTDGPDGGPAPAGMFSLSASTVTVPAKGSADVTVRSNTRVGATLGSFGGQVTASAGAQVVRTPFVVQREGDSHDLTVRHTGRDGQLPSDYSTALYRLDTGESYSFSEADGVVQARLPAGRYTLVSWLYEDGQKLTLITQPLLVLDRDRTVVVDARLARPVSVRPARPDARGVVSEVNVSVPTTQSYPVGYSAGSQSFEGLYVGQVAGAAPLAGFVTRFGTIQARADAQGSFDQSPFAYYLTWYQDGRMPTGFRGTVRPGSLAQVRAEHLAQAPGAIAWKRATSIRGGVGSTLTANLQFTLPFTRTEYYSTDGGVKWQADFQEVLPNDECPWCQIWVSSATDPFVRYRPGSRRTAVWNQGVFGPAMPEPAYESQGVTRLGDTLTVAPQLTSDNAGRDGSSAQTAAHTTVYRNGVKLDETPDRSGVFTLPPRTADYRVEITVDRGSPLALTTRSRVAWTFRSGHVDGAVPQRLPVSAVRFTPALDATSSAPAGRAFSLPVTVQTQPRATGGRTTRLTVEVSYDDGRSWQSAGVTGRDGTWQARVRHPRGAGFVSLRAAATDSRGNRVTEELIRAYRIS